MSSEAIALRPIAVVHCHRTDTSDDDWGSVESTIELDAERFAPEVLLGLDAFSHIEVVYAFHLVREDRIHLGARHPRGRSDWPLTGILAQRAKARPNRLGVSRCALLGVEGLVLRVRGLDAIEGSPVLDIKPYFEEFGPRGEVRQPAWSHEIMKDYYR
ncbi:SAM-dependent methyltransferase [Paraliomyxa miuraensis]|uniref:SAM-dependent methyltransferase n=1 Tax=Paraliomyxa miuraensis TaxID=376150 RepID=UPI002255CACE|nr:SAM-dependent methyltransferase [Paraliomyxa miuraensis]MCX4242444.1 SAM-dependent methyltransferase [Paraliomyxa miuraensis]